MERGCPTGPHSHRASGLPSLRLALAPWPWPIVRGVSVLALATLPQGCLMVGDRLEMLGEVLPRKLWHCSGCPTYCGALSAFVAPWQCIVNLWSQVMTEFISQLPYIPYNIVTNPITKHFSCFVCHLSNFWGKNWHWSQKMESQIAQSTTHNSV